jgi:hypothetical protein
VCKETITKVKEQCKEVMVASKDKQIIEKIKRDIAKHVRSNERAMKKRFNEAWITKHCIEVGDMLHVPIKLINLYFYMITKFHSVESCMPSTSST